MQRAPLALAFALPVLALSATAQTCPTVFDLEPGFNPISSNISGTTAANSAGVFSDNLPFTTFGGMQLFSATDQSIGGELWASDASGAGTAKVKEIFPGSFGSAITKLTPFAGELYFGASSTGLGQELWKTGGSAAGTTLVADLWPGPLGSAPRGLTVLGGRLVFAADTNIGLEPWTFDALTNTALPLTDAGPGLADGILAPSGYGTRAFAPNDAGTQALYWRAGAASTTELWRTDGTVAGTQLVRAFEPAPAGWPFAGAADGFVWWSGAWYFKGWSAATGFELWSTDGTPGGTQLVADLAPGAASSDVRVEFAREFAGALHLVIDDGVHGSELWRTDGSAAGTQLVVDFEPGAAGARPDELTAFGGALWFVAETAATGRELFRMDAGGSVACVADIAAGAADGLRAKENELVVAGARLYFTASEPATGRELWWTDGSGATRVTDLVPGFQDADPDWLTPLAGGDLMFVAKAPSLGRELWRTDGTPAGTQLVANIATESQPLSSDPDLTPPLGARLFVRARSELYGAEPYVVDTAAGTATFVKDIRPGPFGSLLSSAVAFEVEHAWLGGELRTYFAATTDEHGRELWVSDGSEAGTQLVVDGAEDSDPLELTFAGGRLFYSATETEAEGPELFTSDGTAAGTQMLGAFVPGASGGEPRKFVSLGERVVFVANVNGLGGEPWISDGTVAGTQLLKDINDGPLGSVTGEPIRVGGRVFFAANSPSDGVELWATDGTTPGTRRLTDIGPGPASAFPGSFAVANGFLFFGAQRADVGFELWQLDLATNEVRLAADLWPGPTSSNAYQVTAGQAGLFVVGNSPVTGVLEGSLFHLPYTPTGVGAATDVLAGLPGQTVRDLDDLAAAGRGVFFTGHETATGRELYYSDGTPAGTGRVCAATSGTDPRQLTVVDGQLYFAGSEPSVGRELMRVDLGLASAVPLTPARNLTTLHVTPPVLGAKAHLDFHGAPAGAVNLLVLSAPASAPLELAGLTWLDGPSAALFGTLTGPKAFDVPATPSLAGAILHTQVLSVQPTLELASSNAVRLFLGT